MMDGNSEVTHSVELHNRMGVADPCTASPFLPAEHGADRHRTILAAYTVYRTYQKAKTQGGQIKKISKISEPSSSWFKMLKALRAI